MYDENDSVATSLESLPADAGWHVAASFAQERLWFLQQMESHSTAYNLVITLRLNTPLDTQALSLALHEVIARHEVLRTTFGESDGKVLQIVHPNMTLNLRSVDLSRLPGRDAEIEAGRLATDSVAVPFDLTTGPLLRLNLIKLRDGHILNIVAHHIIFDQWSAGILHRELLTAYNEIRDDIPHSLPPLPVQYADYAVWQREWLAEGLIDRQLTYWNSRLAGLRPLPLPTDRPRPPVRTTAGDTVSFTVPQETVERMGQVARKAGASLFMTLVAALQALLARYCGQSDVAVGIPVSGRQYPDIKDLIGFFVNTVVLRSKVNHDDSFLDLLTQVRKVALEAYANQDIPFEMVVDAVHPKRDRGRNPLFDVMLSFRTEDGTGEPSNRSGPTPCDFGSNTAKFDLTFDLTEVGGVIRGTIEYSTELYDRPTVERLGAHFGNLLQAASANPESTVLGLPLLDRSERQDVLVRFPGHATGQNRPAPLVHEMFAAQASRTPAAVALAVGDQLLTYGELEARADRLAGYLRSMNVGREDVVGLYMPRSPGLVIGILGILKAGASYLGVDQGRPADLTRAGMAALIVHTDLTHRLSDGAPATIRVDGFADSPLFEDAPADSAGITGPQPGDAACVVRSPTSEGVSTSVALTHAGLAALAEGARTRLKAGAARSWVLSHPADSDLFVCELSAALTLGHRLVMAPDTAGHVSCGNVLNRNFAALTDLAQGCGGTRSAVGRPLPSIACYVLEDDLTPTPIGVLGELHVGGDVADRGHHRDAAATAGRFVPDPHAADGSRLFRTGTRARWHADGQLEIFHDQGGQDSFVAGASAPGGRRLVAYVVPAPGQAMPGARELRAFLRDRLPDGMIPATFVSLPELPLTSSGKVDRTALPAPEITRSDRVEPTTATERVLAGIWRHVLKVDDVGANDDFFELGGHSLLAAQIVARVRAELNTDLPISTVFDAPTLAGLAALVDGAGQAVPLPAISRVEGGSAELSFAQQRLWFLSRLRPDSSEYNVPFAVELTGELDANALRRAVDEVVTRHEVLRTTITTTADGVPVQVIGQPAAIGFSFVDLSDLPLEEARRQARRLNDTDAAAPFDLAAAPPMRTRLIRVSDHEHVLGVTFHHVASDEWSTGIFTRELSALYEAFRHGAPSPLAPLPVQYADYAAWQRRWLSGETLQRQLDYWRAQLSGLSALDLPAVWPRPLEPDSSGDLYTFTVSPELTDRIRDLSRRTGCSMFMTLLAAFQALLARYIGTDDIAVGTPVAGRTHPDTEHLIGFFVNTLVLRTDTSKDPTFTELLRRVRRTALDAYAHQDLPFDQLVDALQPVRDRRRNPLFDVMFAFDADDDPDPAGLGASTKLADLDLCSIPADRATAKFDLSLELIASGGALRGQARYRTTLFDAGSIERLAAHLTIVLETVAADPDVRLSEIAPITLAERERITAWSTGPRLRVPDRLVHELIAERAAATPEHTAVIAADRRLTYRQLDEEANRLAHHLRTIGVGPEDVVAVCLPRGPEPIIALLAIWKAGGAYLPVDPATPPGRASFQLDDGKACALITTAELHGRLGLHCANVLLFDGPHTRATLDRYPETAPLCGARADNAAYLMYTSGSTGAPKGVVTAHGSLLNRLLWQIDAHGYTPADRVLNKDRIGFDVSLWEMCCPLLAGAVVIVAPPGAERDPVALRRLIDEHAVSITRFVASLLGPFLDTVRDDQCGSLRLILCGGEAVPGALARRWYERFGQRAALHVGYGPTEAAIGVSEHPLEAEPAGDRTAPIGVPVARTRLLVLDDHLRMAPIGVAGELFAGGPQLARGYTNRPSLTAERFVPDPHATDGSRLYRTGDLARWRPDGQLEFLGRVDDQVKIRGHRVEPAEIETALTSHDRIKSAVVVPRAESPGDIRLVSYLVPVPGQEPSTADLRAFLRGRLPDHMIPESFTVLETLPLTMSGKVDRNALPAPDAENPDHDDQAADHQPPRTPTEQALADIWREVLDVRDVGTQDNFFDLGGHSLLAIQVVTRVRARFDVELPVAAVFDKPVLSEYAAAVERALIDEIRRLPEDQVRRLLSSDEDAS